MSARQWHTLLRRRRVADFADAPRSSSLSCFISSPHMLFMPTLYAITYAAVIIFTDFRLYDFLMMPPPPDVYAIIFFFQTFFITL